jgi:hypothetical protein
LKPAPLPSEKLHIAKLVETKQWALKAGVERREEPRVFALLNSAKLRMNRTAVNNQKVWVSW